MKRYITRSIANYLKNVAEQLWKLVAQRETNNSRN